MTFIKLHINEANLSMKEVYGNYSDWKLFCILRRYLEPRKRHLSLKEATILIFKIIMPTKPGKFIEYPAKAFGRVMLDVARQIPYSHTSQGRLVQLLEQFHRFIELNLTNDQETEVLNLVMGGLIQAAREMYNGYLDPSPLERASYLNLSSFLARLASTGILGSSWAIAKMRDALERDISKDTESYKYHMAAAALWIQDYGICLFYAMAHHSQKTGRRIQQKCRVGPLYSGSAFGVGRWNFWRNTFELAVKTCDLNNDCRDLVLSASCLMNEITKIGVVEAR